MALSGVQVIASVPTGYAFISSNTATTNTSGLATFAGLGVRGLAGTTTITFSAAGMVPATANVTIVAGTATQLSITTPPSSPSSSGLAFTTQPVLQLRDGAANAVAQPNVTVTASVPSGYSLVGNATATTNASGVATFTGLQRARTRVGDNECHSHCRCRDAAHAHDAAEHLGGEWGSVRDAADRSTPRRDR